jgi:hypothetical protein
MYLGILDAKATSLLGSHSKELEDDEDAFRHFIR